MILIGLLLLSACSLPAVSPPPPLSTETPPATPAITATSPDPQNCGYQWAYQDLPELSNSFQNSIQALQPGAQANAFVFGENCILTDGSVGRFIPMETDFNVSLRLEDIANEALLGEWIVRVMEVIEAIPADEIVGPRPGRVGVTFASGTAQTGVNFYIDRYQALPAGLSNAEIYNALQIPAIQLT